MFPCLPALQLAVAPAFAFTPPVGGAAAVVEAIENFRPETPVPHHPAQGDPAGELTYSVPLDLPPGIVAPPLRLVYNSRHGLDREMPYGWSIEGIARLEKPNNLHAYPDYWWFYTSPQESGVLRAGGGGPYRLSTTDPGEVNFSYSSGADTWTAQSTLDGTWTLEAGDSGATSGAGTSVWRGTEYIDNFGNCAEFTYDTHHRISQIEYGADCDAASPQHTVRITFSYESLPDTHTNARGGFVDQMGMAVDFIQIDGWDDTLGSFRTVRTYELNNVPSGGFLLLDSVHVEGYDDDGTIDVEADRSFVYSEYDGTTERAGETTYPFADFGRTATSEDCSGGGTTESREEAALVDFTGDGLPDYVESDGTGNWYVYPQLIDSVTGYHYWNATPDSFTGPAHWIDEWTNDSSWSEQNTRLVDLDGDGWQDLVTNLDYSAGSKSTHWAVYYGNGTDFDPVVWEHAPDTSIEVRNTYIGPGGAGLMFTLQDIDGDGWLDYLQSFRSASDQIDVYLHQGGRGGGWATTPTHVTAPWISDMTVGQRAIWAGFDQTVTNQDYVSVCGSTSLASTEAFQLGALQDINGDGFPDYILTDHGTFGSVAAGTWSVYLGNGHGWEPARPWTAPSNIMGYTYLGEPSVPKEHGTQLLDVDGDGLVDLVVEEEGSGPEWYANLGDSFDSVAQPVPGWWPSPWISESDVTITSGESYEAVRSTVRDLDHDGVLDAVDLRWSSAVHFGTYSRPNLLISVDTGTGLQTDIGYDPIASIGTSGVHGDIQQCSAALDVVSAVDTTDSVTGRWAETSYDYERQYYLGGVFRGFDDRVITDDGSESQWLRKTEEWDPDLDINPDLPPLLTERWTSSDDCLRSVPGLTRCATATPQTRIIEGMQYGTFGSHTLLQHLTVIQDGDEVIPQPMPTYNVTYDYDDWGDLTYAYHDGGPDGGTQKDDVEIDVAYVTSNATPPELVRVSSVTVKGWDALTSSFRPLEMTEYGYDAEVGGWLAATSQGLLDEIRQLDWYYNGGESPATGGAIVTDYNHDSRGQISEIVEDPSGSAATTDVTFGYGDAVLETETTPIRSFEHEWDWAGRTTVDRDLDNGVETDTDYDGLGRVASTHAVDQASVTHAVVGYTYNHGALPFQDVEKRYRDDGTVESTNFSILDGQGLVTQSWKQSPTGDWDVVDHVHDLWGFETATSKAYSRAAYAWTGFGGTPRARTWRDGLGVVREADRGLGASHQLTAANPFNVVITDEEGFQSSRTYDAHGRIIEVDQGRNGERTETGSYEYDALGHVVKFTNATGSVYKYWYDAAGRLRSVQGPDIGAVNYGYANFDRVARSDSSGNWAQWTYDLGHRPLTLQMSDPYVGVANYTWVWDTAWVGAIASTTDPRGTETYGYDLLGRPDAAQRTFTSGPTATYAFVNDIQGRVVHTTTPGGLSLDNDFSQHGWWTRLLSSGSELAHVTYDVEGRVMALQAPTAGMNWSVTYGGNLLPSRIDYHHGPFNPWRTYTWKQDGLMASMGTPLGTTNYAYDDLQRLTSATGYHPESFTWDAAGNPLTETDWAGNHWTYAPATGSEVHTRTTGIQTETSTWDAAGYLSTWTDGAVAYTYKYDGLGRLRVILRGGVISNLFDRDADGDVVRRVAGDPTNPATPVTYQYKDWSYRPAIAKVHEELKLANVVIGDVDGGITRWYFSELGGNVAAVTNGAGNVVGQRTLSAFGTTIAKAGAPSNLRSFQGHLYDPDAERYVLGPRTMNDIDGQFGEPDPVLLDGIPAAFIEDPQRLNPYRFARNAPTTMGDSSGRFVDTIADVAFIAYDVYELSQDPHSVTNWVALGGDVAGALLPGVTGVGEAVRVAEVTKDAVEIGTDVGRLSEHVGTGAEKVVAHVEEDAAAHGATDAAGHGGGGCFLGDTEVETTDGPTAIADIRPGDHVLADDAPYGATPSAWEPVESGKTWRPAFDTSGAAFAYEPRTGDWVPVGGFADVDPGTEVLRGGVLFDVTSDGPQMVGYATGRELEAADEPWDPAEPHRAPASADWVLVLGSPSYHEQLADVRPGMRIVFEGRVFETRGGERGITAVRQTTEVVGQVRSTSQHPVDEIRVVSIARPDGTIDRIAGTGNHPFWVASRAQWIPLGDLWVGAVLQTGEHEQATVVALSEQSGEYTVFNFVVDGEHDYFVRAPGGEEAGVLVHNGEFGPCVANLGPDSAAQRAGRPGPSVPAGKAVAVEKTADGLKATSRPKTVTQARSTVRSGRDVYASDEATAREIAGGNRVGPETHLKPGESRFDHYHLDNREGGHIFFGEGSDPDVPGGE